MTHISTRDNTQLYVKDWGTGRPVILIHGWPLSADMWDYHAMHLAAAGYRTIAYDRRGFGRSSQPWSGYDYDTLSDDLADVMAAVEANDATLVGFSMGGGEVARYLSRHAGQGVAQCVLVSSIVPYLLRADDNPAGIGEAEFTQMTLAIEADRPKFFGDFFKQFYGEGMLSHPVSQECLTWTQNLAMQASLKATLDCAQAFATTDFRDELAAFDKPTLIIHGTSDQTVPIETSGRAAAKGIPRAKLVEYEKAPHGLTVTHREQLRDDLLAFLQG